MSLSNKTLFIEHQNLIFIRPCNTSPLLTADSNRCTLHYAPINVKPAKGGWGGGGRGEGEVGEVGHRAGI